MPLSLMAFCLSKGTCNLYKQCIQSLQIKCHCCNFSNKIIKNENWKSMKGKQWESSNVQGTISPLVKLFLPG